MHTDGNTTITELKILCLNLLSIAFKTISLINLKRKGRKPTKYPAHIISIDNLSFGGTGKTTLVLQLGRALEENDLKFAIVTRGYKAKYENDNLAVTQHHTAADVGDEAKMFKRRFPNQDIYIGRNRKISIEAAIAGGNSIILLDDGFQTTNVQKDTRVMLVNPQHPYYFLRNFKCTAENEDYVFLYQPPGHDTNGATAKWKTKLTGPAEPGKKKPVLGTYYFEKNTFYDTEGQPVDTEKISLLGFSALGDNIPFKKILSAQNLVEFKAFDDHYPFTPADIERLNQTRMDKEIDTLACTEKDFIKLIDIKVDHIPLIYAKNSIKFSIDLIYNLLTNAKEKN
ncbi:MAG: tetraacyldisaccharide 4'-kinase [bacterium]|nr:tetraacyldisaccharide 4'-kinase [bacterium]